MAGLLRQGRFFGDRPEDALDKDLPLTKVEETFEPGKLFAQGLNRGNQFFAVRRGPCRMKRP